MTIAHLLKLEARGYMLPERDAGRLREFRRQLRADAMRVALSGRVLQLSSAKETAS